MTISAIEPSTLFAILANHPTVKDSGLAVRDVTWDGTGYRITAKNPEGDVFLFTILAREDGEVWEAPEVVDEGVRLVEAGALRVRAMRQGLVLPDEHGRFRDGGVIR